MYGAFEAEEMIAAVRLLRYQDFHLVRSLLVHPQWRRQGIGAGLMQCLMSDISGRLIAIPTPVARNLYQQLGFQPLPMDQIPAQLLNSYRRVRQSDQGAPVMAITL